MKKENRKWLLLLLLLGGGYLIIQNEKKKKAQSRSAMINKEPLPLKDAAPLSGGIPRNDVPKKEAPVLDEKAQVELANQKELEALKKRQEAEKAEREARELAEEAEEKRREEYERKREEAMRIIAEIKSRGREKMAAFSCENDIDEFDLDLI